MKVEIFYDISCTWCRVAKANLHKVVDELVAAGKLKEDEVEFVFRGYELHPEVSVEGEDYKAKKIADDDTEDWDPAKNTPIHRAAKRAGLNFDFDRITVLPNTAKAHQLLYLVRDIKPEAIEPLLGDMQQAYFEDGLNVNDLDVLCALAKKYVNDVYPLKQKVLAGEKLDELKYSTETIGDDKYDLQLCPMLVFDEKVKLEGMISAIQIKKALLGELEVNCPNAK